MQIRRLLPTDDTDALGRLVLDAYFALEGGLTADDPYTEVLADVRGRAAQDYVDVIVAVDDDGAEGRVVGCLTFVPSNDNEHGEFDDPDAASFRYFGVDPAVQGRGVGRAMVQWCIDEARRLGRERIRIHTITVMLSAQRMYEQMGFRRTPELDEDWDGTIGLAYVYEL